MPGAIFLKDSKQAVYTEARLAEIRHVLWSMSQVGIAAFFCRTAAQPDNEMP